MFETALTILFFGLGFFAQAYFLVARKFDGSDIKTVILCLLISCVTVFYIFVEFSSEDFGFLKPTEIAFVFFAVFAFYFYGFFRKKIICEINELSITVWNVVFLYTLFVHFGVSLFTGMLFVPSLICLIIVLFPHAPSWKWKAFLYSWFLFMMVFLSFFQFRLSQFGFFFSNSPGVAIDPIAAAFLGAVFLYVIVYSIFILMLLPLAGENQTHKDRMQEIREHALFLSSGYSDVQVHHLYLIAFISIFTVVLSANLYTGMVSDATVINLLLVLTSLQLRHSNKKYVSEVSREATLPL